MSGTDFTKIMPEVAQHFLGQPNRAQSNKRDLRFGTHGSISVSLVTGAWYDHETKEGGGCLDFIKRQGIADPAKWLREHGFVNGNGDDQSTYRVVATYDYADEFGKLVYVVERREPREFRQRHPDGKGGWIWDIKGIKRLPYRLPELIEAVALERPIYIPEGEKDVLTLVRHGLDATCNSGGARKWRAEFANYLDGADIIILPDNDDVGHDHAQDIARSLAGKAARIRILELPGLKPKGDVTDWFSAGGKIEQFNELVEKASDWQPQPSEGRPPEFSDAALALAFAERHSDTLRYVASWAHWMLFGGGIWREEQTLLAFDLARAICSEAAEQCRRKTEKKQLASARTVAAVVTLARASRLLAATSEQWNAKHSLLNMKDKL